MPLDPDGAENEQESTPCSNGATSRCGPDTELGICVFGERTCEGSTWGPCVGAVLPAARDCRSSEDNDCDGLPDDNIDGVCQCVPGSKEMCDEHPGLDRVGSCQAGERICEVSAAGTSSTWGDCLGAVGPSPDSCTALGDDSDCNGTPNTGCTCINGQTIPCGPATNAGVCERGTSTCVNQAFSECVGAIYPSRRDCSSSADNDCDGRPDNDIDAFCTCAPGSSRACGAHPGRDGFGICQPGTQTCNAATDGGSSRFGNCQGSIGPMPSDSCTAAGDDSNCDGDVNGNCREQGESCGAGMPACGPGLSCANGVCCDEPCDGACQTCGAGGVCETQRPHSFCGPGEQCNGSGECVFTGQGLVSAGSQHTCAITSAARVRCWGHNVGGILGYGHSSTIGDNETPAEAAAQGLGGDLNFGSNERIYQVSVGSSFACALVESGRVRCWGGTGAGVEGQGRNRLGTLDVTPNAAGLIIPSGVGDVDFGGRRAVRIDTGEFATCAVLETGEMGCWGNGFLGNGATSEVLERPGANVLLAGRVALRVALGSTHRCVLLSDGGVNCWGPGFDGTTGYGVVPAEFYSAPPPNQIVPLGGPVVSIAASFFHSCAVIQGGAAQCWGANDAGQLGYGNTATFAPNTAAGIAGNLALGGSAIALAEGARCAVMTDRSLRCWGRNNRGQAGAGDPALVTQGAVIGLRPLVVDLE